MAAATTCEHLSERAFELVWEIENWGNVRPSEALLENTNAIIHCKEDYLEYAKILVGFRISSNSQERHVHYYWELIDKHHCLHNLDANLVIEMLKSDGDIGVRYKSHASAVIGSPIDFNNQWYFPYRGTPADILSWTTTEGSLIIKLKLTLTNIPNASYFSKAEELRKICKDEVSQNLTALLENGSSSDVKIVTKDKTEFLAHKAILLARCPVFATMFGSDFMESRTGVVNVNDISAKTMEILLKYWYSGELLPCWKDSAIIVEFVYAAGKYQMTKVLNMIDDDYSGLDFHASDGDIQLLKMVHNLSLKSVEHKILKRIVYNFSQAENVSDLLNLFPMETADIGDEDFKASEVLKVFDDVLSNQDNNETCTRDMKLMMWAGKLGLKNVESKLLKRIIEKVSKVISAEEIFELFASQNDEEGDDTKGLLVRANKSLHSLST